MDKTRISIFISKLLRHRPEIIGLTIDRNGWADVDELIEGVRRHKAPDFDREALDDIVASDAKQRYSYSEDGRRIRANQGHSIPVDVELTACEPPEYLWHGTGEKYVPSIDRTGLLPKSRLYVHLSSDMETARKVGSRHGKPVVYEIDCSGMVKDGYSFFLSANHIWLTKEVPARYLKKL